MGRGRTPKNNNYLTLTAKASVAVASDQQALLLGLVGFAATKLWNTAQWHCKEVWAATGKIPSFPELDKALKNNRWYRSMHAQSAQAVLEELWESYKSWFGKRRSDPKARPPGFRRKGTLSTVTFKKDSLQWDAATNMLRLGIQSKVFDHRYLFLKLQLPSRFTDTNDTTYCIDPKSIQVARLIYHQGGWQVHLAFKVKKPQQQAVAGQVMALDLGMVQLAAVACTDGRAELYSGGELLALERYFAKEKAKCTNMFSRNCIRRNRKRSRQRQHLVHTFTRSVINDAQARGVTTILVGKLTGIRTGKDGMDKNWGDGGNQQLHGWPFALIVTQLKYKAALAGIEVLEVSEAYSSQTCCCCKTRKKKQRVHRGLYVCRKCGAVIQADVNGAVNMLERYLLAVRGVRRIPWSSGCLAQPVVNRFDWRKASLPLKGVRGPGTFVATGSIRRAATNRHEVQSETEGLPAAG